MTVAIDALTAPRSRRVASLGERLLEFMLVGGFTLVLFPLSWALRAAFGLEAVELAVGFSMFHLAYVINDPHFSVTYLLFYRDVKARALSPAFSLAQRVRYCLAGFVLPGALASASVAALMLQSSALLGALIQLMFVLVGWHYIKQGFGVLAVLCARRGVLVMQRERRALLWHGYAAWAFAWANPAMPAGLFEEKGVVYWSVAHPRWLELGAGAALASSGVWLLWVLLAKWRQERQLLPLAALSGFLISTWAWSIFSALDPVVRYAIPALHSIQYLYFVWLLERGNARAHEGPPTFGRPPAVRLAALALSALGLGWLLLRGAPTLLDEVLASTGGKLAGSELGPTPLFAAFFVFVNIHHYLMDAVIWRRENPEMRYLSQAEELDRSA